MLVGTPFFFPFICEIRAKMYFHFVAANLSSYGDCAKILFKLIIVTSLVL